MDNNKIIVFIKEYESEGKLERVADIKATLKYAEKLLNSMDEEETETPEGHVIFNHLIAACVEMERYLQDPLSHQIDWESLYQKNLRLERLQVDQ